MTFGGDSTKDLPPGKRRFAICSTLTLLHPRYARLNFILKENKYDPIKPLLQYYYCNYAAACVAAFTRGYAAIIGSTRLNYDLIIFSRHDGPLPLL